MTDREPAGYFYNRHIPADPDCSGGTSAGTTLSWARAAGAIISTTSDMTRWERALYGGRLLPPQQQSRAESLVSIDDAASPSRSTSATDPQGFGLGIAQLTDPQIGTFWFYEGETLAFRAVHVYLPGLEVWSSPSA